MIKQDPALYRRLSEPHESLQSLQRNIDEFFDEVSVLREKYRLPDMFLVVAANVSDGEQECAASASLHRGSSERILMLLSRALRDERRRLEAIVDTVMTEKAPTDAATSDGANLKPVEGNRGGQ